MSGGKEWDWSRKEREGIVRLRNDEFDSLIIGGPVFLHPQLLFRVLDSCFNLDRILLFSGHCLTLVFLHKICTESLIFLHLGSGIIYCNAPGRPIRTSLSIFSSRSELKALNGFFSSVFAGYCVYL